MSTPDETFAELFQRGEKLLADGKLEEAITAFGRASDQQPDAFWPFYRCGESHLRLQRPAEAESFFRRSIETIVNRDQRFCAHFSLGKSLSEQHRWADALDPYEQAIQISPHEFWAHYELAQALAKLERWEEAVKAFERAEALNADFPPLQVELANALINSARGSEAIDRYEQAVADRPDDHALRFYLGLALANSNRTEQAIESFQKANEISADFSPALEQLGEAYLKLERFKEAEDSLRKALNLSPTPNTWRVLGKTLIMQSRPSDAITAFVYAISRDPNQTEAYTLLGSALEQDGRLGQAVRVYQQAKRRGVADEDIETRLSTIERDSPESDGDALESTHSEPTGSSSLSAHDSIDGHSEGSESERPIVLVVCNDYGELALAMYMIEGQSFAQNTTLMLPPRLYANNSDILPGRTVAYHSCDDIQRELGSAKPGMLGLFSGYLLPMHNLCGTGELDSLLRSAHANGWQSMTSDPFLGLIEDGKDRRDLLARRSEAKSALDKLLIDLLLETHTTLRQIPHVYPLGVPPKEVDFRSGKRFCFHNPAIGAQPDVDDDAPADRPTPTQASPRWLFVLGSEDYNAQKQRFSAETFCANLVRKLEETLKADRIPTLIAPAEIVEAVREQCPVSDSMELLPHCEYSRFMSLLKDAEYVLYWNAVSFSGLLRIMLGKPWFTFDSGHLINTMSAEYVARISSWFYLSCEPPRIEIGNPLTSEGLRQSTLDYQSSARRIQEAILASPDPQSLLSAISALGRPH